MKAQINGWVLQSTESFTTVNGGMYYIFVGPDDVRRILHESNVHIVREAAQGAAQGGNVRLLMNGLPASHPRVLAAVAQALRP